MNELEICALKAKARRLYLAIHRRAGELDCGAALADFIRPDIPRMEREFAAVMERLRELDPNAPRGRA